MLLTSAWPGAPTHSDSAGVDILRIPGRLGPHLAAPIVKLGFRPEVVIDDLAHAAPWMTPWLSATPGIAFFHHLHRRTLGGQATWPLRAILTAAERMYPQIYRRWRFVTESHSARDDLIALGVPAGKVRCVPPGVNLGVFVPTLKTPVPSLVYFGGLRRYKRPLKALSAFAHLRRQGLDLRLVVAGEGPMLPIARRFAAEEGVAQSVDFVGRLSEPALSRLVAQSWVNIHTSEAEGWGFSIAEATACGTPTVAFSVPGVRDSVADGSTGLLVADGNEERLAGAIERILSDPGPWIDRCLRRGRTRNWDLVAKEWADCLRRVVSEHGDRWSEPPC